MATGCVLETFSPFLFSFSSALLLDVCSPCKQLHWESWTSAEVLLLYVSDWISVLTGGGVTSEQYQKTKDAYCMYAPSAHRWDRASKRKQTNKQPTNQPATEFDADNSELTGRPHFAQSRTHGGYITIPIAPIHTHTHTHTHTHGCSTESTPHTYLSI